ncbi:MAG TPA: thiol-disulfide isomerase [Bryobacteraceae bacterium]
MRAVSVVALVAVNCWVVSAATFHKDVEPLLERHCQGCHHAGDIGPMPLVSYEQVRPWAKAIRAAVLQKKMPPWFADPAHGKFLNDRSLTQAEIDTFKTWIDTGAVEGDPKDAPAPLHFSEGWHMGEPDVVIQIPQAFHVPAKGTVPYQYIVVPTNFTEDKWVQSVEVRPSNRKVVHHINLSATPPSKSGARPTGFFTSDAEARMLAALKPGQEPPQFAAAREGDLLETFVPGGLPPELQPGQAKLVKAGSSLMFQLHYTTIGTPQEDQTSVGFIFAKEPPRERIKSILVYNTHFTIPAGASSQMIGARAEVLHDVKMVSILPHMHLRGKDFQVRATYPSGESEILLRVPNYDFNWQVNYYLDKPKILPKGTVLEVTGHYDNSVNNPFNPDATVDVHYGEQTWEEMLNGFMEVAIEPTTDTPELLGPGSGPFLPVNATASINDSPVRAPGR